MNPPNKKSSINTSKFQKCQIIEKKAQRRRKAKYVYIEPIARLLKPYFAYKIHSDILLFEDNRVIYSDFSAISRIKCINHVTHETVPYNTVKIVFEDNPNAILTPCAYLVARLRSYGEKDSYEWATMIEEFCSDYQRLYKSLLEDAVIKANESPHRNDLMDEIIMKKPAFWFDVKYDVDKIITTSYSFNLRLLLLLNYQLEIFISKIIVEGIPLLNPIDDPYAKISSKKAFKNLFKTMFKEMSYTRKTHVINAQDELIPVIQQYYAFNYIDKTTGCLYVRHLFTVEMHSLVKQKLNESTLIPVINQEFVQKITNLKQDSERLIQRFYYKDYDEEIIKKKVCKIRILNQ